MEEGAGTSRRVFAIEQVVACAGDYRTAHTVSLEDVITLIDIALGSTRSVECGSGGAGRGGEIPIDEIITAVNHALNRCA